MTTYEVRYSFDPAIDDPRDAEVASSHDSPAKAAAAMAAARLVIVANEDGTVRPLDSEEEGEAKAVFGEHEAPRTDWPLE